MTTTERLTRFITRAVRSWQGEPAVLDDYTGPRPWQRVMESRESVLELRSAYDLLLEKYGPREDIPLPKPPDNITIGTFGSMSRHDLFQQLMLKPCGDTLASYGRLKLEEAAYERGEWVRDRFLEDVYGRRWKRKAGEPYIDEDGQLVMIADKKSASEPPGAFKADLSVLKPAPAIIPPRPR